MEMRMRMGIAERKRRRMRLIYYCHRVVLRGCAHCSSLPSFSVQYLTNSVPHHGVPSDDMCPSYRARGLAPEAGSNGERQGMAQRSGNRTTRSSWSQETMSLYTENVGPRGIIDRR